MKILKPYGPSMVLTIWMLFIIVGLDGMVLSPLFCLVLAPTIAVSVNELVERYQRL